MARKSLKVDKEEVTKSVLDRLKTDMDDRSGWLEKYLRLYAKYRGWTEPKEFPFGEYSSNIHLPLLMIHAQRIQDSLYNAVFSFKPVVSSKALQPHNLPKQSRIDNLLDYQIFTEASGKQVLDDFIQNFTVDGTTIATVLWVKETRHFFEVVEIEKAPETESDWWIENLKARLGNVRDIEPDGENGLKFEYEKYREWLKAKAKFYSNEKGYEMELSGDAVQYIGPSIVTEDIEDIVTPSNASNLQPISARNPKGAHHVFRLCAVPFGEFKRRWKQGIYDMISEEDVEAIEASIKEKIGSFAEDTLPKEQKDEIEGVQSQWSAADHETVRMVEAYDRWDVNGDGLEEDVVFWVTRDGEKLCRARYLTEVSPSGKRPFVEARFIRVSNRFYGLGVPELAETLQDIMDTSFNQSIDYGTITNAPFFFYRASSGMKPEVIRLAPGEGYPLDVPKEDVYFPQLPNQGQAWSFNIITLTNQFLERLTMMGDVQMGRVPTGRASALRTYGTTMALLQQGDVRIERVLQRLFDGINQIYRLVFAYDQKFMPKEKEYRILGVPEEGEDVFGKIGREELEGEYEFEFGATMLNANRQTMTQGMISLMQILINPLLIQLGLVGKDEVYRLVKDYVQALQIPYADKYIKRPPDMPEGLPLTAEEAISSIIDGILPQGMATVEPLREHYEKLMKFAESEQFGYLPAEHVSLFSVYLKNVMALLQKEEFQKQVMEQARNFQNLLMQGGAVGGGGVPTSVAAPPLGEMGEGEMAPMAGMMGG